MKTIEEIEKDIEVIQERNKRVELDKAWETSFARRITIMALTYIVASIWLLIINETHVLLKAIVPVLGYLLSTLSIPYVRKMWMRRSEV
ncbi:MAG TPA: hypothetical protein VJH55_02625 [Candidatus Paceibacterota bacterium]